MAKTAALEARLNARYGSKKPFVVPLQRLVHDPLPNRNEDTIGQVAA